MIAERAQAHGATLEQYLQLLIEADNQTFDEILEPVRQGFESMSDDELDGLLARAKKAAQEAQ
jgi:hypothetical protein